MDTDQIKQKLRTILIDKGITSEAEIQQRIEDMLNPRRDLMQFATPENQVFPTPFGLLKQQQIEETIASHTIEENRRLANMSRFARLFSRLLDFLFRKRRKRMIALLERAKNQKPMKAWEFWERAGVTHVKLSDGTIREVPKKPVK